VLSGGLASVYDPGAPQAPAELWDSSIPVLGICYGMGLLARGFGGEMTRVEKREEGPATLDAVTPHPCRRVQPSHFVGTHPTLKGARESKERATTTVRALLKAGTLRGIQNGRRILISDEEIARLLREHAGRQVRL
jgi:GMP synthase-like glutamine amidotransferase